MDVCFVMQSASRLGYGLFPVVLGTSQALLDRGVGVRVVAGTDARSSEDAAEWGQVPVTCMRLLPPRSIHYAPGLARWFRAEPAPSVFSLHGVWMAMHGTTVRFAKRHRIPVLLTPHGSLDPWAMALSRSKKRLARLLYADRVLFGVDCYHALNLEEAQAIRNLGIAAPVAIVPNGVDMPPPVLRAGQDPIRKLVFMGRIHGKKGIRELVSAWRTLHQEFPAWELVVAGPDEVGMRAELEQAAAGTSVRFVGEVRGEAKATLLRDADAFILPSFSEGLPMTVLEAWSYGLPVLMTRECNIGEGFSQRAAFELRPDVASIADALRSFFRLAPEARWAAGERGRALVQQKFSWTRVAEDLQSVYAWLHGNEPAPPCVYRA
jgi:glycosyltransferase involved in cell wall biosynthesis